MTPILFTATTKPDEARDFYTQVMGFALTEDSPFSLSFDACGTMLRVQKVQDFTPLPFTLFGWQVDDIAAKIDELHGRGAVFERFDFMGQDERGVWTAADGAKVAWFKDPDGNTLSLSEFG
ncbi:MAG: VOC family protein [Erythrobacter sp.]|uniref:VOC family protein n=1 Tax=Erythrobacter sp. TaxID=1042 RepID=UPI0026358E9A|nr:VOC family protein [Erythrobacter sp.]MDJ0978788.1 VOC family protein [Erythrobacter sp.]